MFATHNKESSFEYKISHLQHLKVYYFSYFYIRRIHNYSFTIHKSGIWVHINAFNDGSTKYIIGILPNLGIHNKMAGASCISESNRKREIERGGGERLTIHNNSTLDPTASTPRGVLAPLSHSLIQISSILRRSSTVSIRAAADVINIQWLCRA